VTGGARGPICVVVVDDQALVRMGLRTLLESEADIELVGEAVDGRSGVDAVRAARPHVVLMDIRMPALDGLAALRVITSDPALSGVRVIMLTTFELDEYVFEALRGGGQRLRPQGRRSGGVVARHPGGRRRCVPVVPVGDPSGDRAVRGT
jgi:chemotaxis response regulator CheB